ncbi:MAG: adenosylmethionine decarboxylase [Alphaproteobacteria bacterium]|nr:adenosylmethionine decarboxylase [Alphaproteobacteria bacterium]
MDQPAPLFENPEKSYKMSAPVELSERDSATKDFFKESNGEIFAGAHVLVDLWGVNHLDDIEYIEQALREAVDACNATLLHIHLHHFGDGCGVSGVAVLAESHISVHTWPERGFAAFDIFMCGACEPELALPVLQKLFEPERMTSDLQKRGVTR